MDTEVELKYLVLAQDVEAKITSLLTTENLSFEKNTKLLSNCYFDTADLKLRKKDYGLRVRGCNNQLEQTIKTAGVVVGGLHQRPEYNVDITQPFPELSLFPADIWIDENETAQLQQQLIALFDTDFKRIIWLVKFKESTIELAFDQGTISSDGRTIEIAEIELELVTGTVDAIFELAKLLFKPLLLRPGIRSKAARGYQLWHNNTPEAHHINLQISANVNTNTLTSYFNQGIEHCLQQLHLSVDNYICQPNYSHLADLVDVLVMLRHGFWLADLHLTDHGRKLRDELSYFIQLFAWLDNAIYLQELMNKTGNYRKKLELSQQLIERLRIEKKRFPETDHVIELMHSERFNQLQLSLLELIVLPSEQTFSPLMNTIDYHQYAREKLSVSLQELTSALPDTPLNIEQYLALRKLLRRSLLTGSWFGHLFNQQLRDQFRLPWLDIQQGLSELQSLSILHQQLERVEEAPVKLVKWHRSKLDNLMTALEHSKQSAMTQQPYWEE